MKKIIITLFVSLLFTSTFAKEVYRSPARPVAKFKYSIEFIFEKVLEKKGFTKNDSIPFPLFYYESKTPLIQFQNAIFEQWGFKPDQITNAYVLKNNEIYITDDAEYYLRLGRCIDDSVAHELVHYVQAKYNGWDINDESLEWQAIEIQTAFREEYCK